MNVFILWYNSWAEPRNERQHFQGIFTSLQSAQNEAMEIGTVLDGHWTEHLYGFDFRDKTGNWWFIEKREVQ